MKSMVLIFAAVLVVLIGGAILRDAYQGWTLKRSRRSRWADGGIALLALVFLFLVFQYALTVP